MKIKLPVITTEIKHPFMLDTYGFCIGYDFTPALASFLLAHFNRINPRKINLSRAKRYAMEILNGLWEPESGNTIQFERFNYQIQDGATRLKAIELSGQTVRLSVCYGAPSIAISQKDRNRARSFGQAQGSCHGFNQNENARLTRTGSIARAWLASENKFKQEFLTDSGVMSNYLKRKSVIDFVYDEQSGNKRVGVLAACAQYIHKFPKEGKTFFRLIFGDTLPKENTPIYYLQQYLQGNPSLGGMAQVKRDYQATLGMIHAWHLNHKVTSLTSQSDWSLPK